MKLSVLINVIEALRLAKCEPSISERTFIAVAQALSSLGAEIQAEPAIVIETGGAESGEKMWRDAVRDARKDPA